MANNPPSSQDGSLTNSLIGWWTFDEGAGQALYDSSGNGYQGAWQGTAAGANGYYSPGKVGPWAGSFNGRGNKRSSSMLTPIKHRSNPDAGKPFI